MTATAYALPDTPQPTGTSTTPVGHGWVSEARARSGLPLVVIVEECHQALTDSGLQAQIAELYRTSREGSA